MARPSRIMWKGAGIKWSIAGIWRKPGKIVLYDFLKTTLITVALKVNLR
jgi:hypothetical protein